MKKEKQKYQSERPYYQEGIGGSSVMVHAGRTTPEESDHKSRRGRVSKLLKACSQPLGQSDKCRHHDIARTSLSRVLAPIPNV